MNETKPNPVEIGTRVGRAIARDVLADGYRSEWTGLDPLDADQFMSAGLELGTAEWKQAEDAAETAYQSIIGVKE